MPGCLDCGDAGLERAVAQGGDDAAFGLDGAEGLPCLVDERAGECFIAARAGGRVGDGAEMGFLREQCRVRW